MTYTSQTDKQCRKSDTFNRYVWGYKTFDTDNKTSIPQQKQTWLIENKEGTKSGYANYYNIKLYKDLNPVNIFDEAVTFWFLIQMLSLIPITIPANFPSLPSNIF